MNDQIRRVLLAGGTGFVGEAIRNQLREDRFDVRLLVRSRADADKYAEQGFTTVYGDVLDPQTLFTAMAGIDAVVNLVAIVKESKETTFEEINFHGTANLVNAACQARVGRFVQMSALGAGNLPDFPYHYTKWRAETYVMDRIPDWTIVRPSIIYGPSSERNFQFVSQLADVLRMGPVVPIPGDGRAKFQPIHASDIGVIFSNLLRDHDASGKALEFGGPEVLTYREMIDNVARVLEIRKPIVNVPVPLIRIGATIMDRLPLLDSPVTTDQLKMLQIDNTTTDNAAGEVLGRPPRRFDEELDFLRTQY